MPRIRLADDDVLVYLHIPKTAGSSLISIVDQQFEPGRIFPFHSANEIHGRPRLPRNARRRYRFVRGHLRLGPFDRLIYQHVVQNPLVFTVLRDPVERTISAFRHIWRHEDNALNAQFVAQQITLLDFVRRPEFARRVVDHQARQIAGALVPRPHRWVEVNPLQQQVLLQLALERLDQMCFVGLTERFAESVHLLARLFGWDTPEQIPQLNRAPRPTLKQELTEEELAAIHAVTEVDHEVYRAARRRFESDLAEPLALHGTRPTESAHG